MRVIETSNSFLGKKIIKNNAVWLYILFSVQHYAAL